MRPGKNEEMILLEVYKVIQLVKSLFLMVFLGSLYIIGPFDESSISSGQYKLFIHHDWGGCDASLFSQTVQGATMPDILGLQQIFMDSTTKEVRTVVQSHTSFNSKTPAFQFIHSLYDILGVSASPRHKAHLMNISDFDPHSLQWNASSSVSEGTTEDPCDQDEMALQEKGSALF